MDQPCVSLWRHDAAIVMSGAFDLVHQLQSQMAILDKLIAERDRQIAHLRLQLAGEQRDREAATKTSSSRRLDLLVDPAQRTQRKAA